MVKTNRSIWMYILLTIVTCGIYGYIFYYEIARDVNVICEGDGEETGGLLKFILLGIVTCGIYCWIWYYKLGDRLQKNAPRYGLTFQESGSTVLLWMLVGILLCGIGPLVGLNIIIKNTNALANAYNAAHGNGNNGNYGYINNNNYGYNNNNNYNNAYGNNNYGNNNYGNNNNYNNTYSNNNYNNDYNNYNNYGSYNNGNNSNNNDNNMMLPKQ